MKLEICSESWCVKIIPADRFKIQIVEVDFLKKKLMQLLIADGYEVKDLDK